MTQQHPIVPPPELVKQWIKEFSQPNDPRWQEYEQDIATRAAQWGADQQLKLDAEQIEKAYQAGADQELEACCEWLYDRYDSVRHATGFPGSDMSDWLRTSRRPKPPSLKEQALEALAHILSNSSTQLGADTIRRALEQLPDYE